MHVMLPLLQKDKDGKEVDEEKKSLLTLLVQNVLRNPYIWGMVSSYLAFQKPSIPSRADAICSSSNAKNYCLTSVSILVQCHGAAWSYVDSA